MGSTSSAESPLDVAGAVGREVVVPLATALGGHGEKQSGGTTPSQTLKRIRSRSTLADPMPDPDPTMHCFTLPPACSACSSSPVVFLGSDPFWNQCLTFLFLLSRKIGIAAKKIITPVPPSSLPPFPFLASQTTCVEALLLAPDSCSPPCSVPHTTCAVPRSGPSATPSSVARSGISSAQSLSM